MGIADDLERRLEKVVEGAFAKAFKSDVQPSEIGRSLMREMERGKTVSVGAVYVPNIYLIDLSSRDHERFRGLAPTLVKEFTSMLKEFSRERRWRPAGAVEVSFRENDELKAGRFEVRAEHASVEEVPSEEIQLDAPVLVSEEDPSVTWQIDEDQMTLGRAGENGIVVPDPNASRQHAEISRRGSGWWVTDLGSTNGTLVNGSLVKERQLSHGDRIQVGGTVMVFREAGGR